MANQIYPSELQLNEANTSDTNAPFLIYIYFLRFCFLQNSIISPFLHSDIPRRPSYGVYISQLIRFPIVCSHVYDFDTRNKCIIAKLLKQGYLYHKLNQRTNGPVNAHLISWPRISI